MSKKQITLELNITPTVADAQIKASAEKIKDALSRVKLDKSNLNVFKELSEWLDVIDAKVSELKKIDGIKVYESNTNFIFMNYDKAVQLN